MHGHDDDTRAIAFRPHEHVSSKKGQLSSKTILRRYLWRYVYLRSEERAVQIIVDFAGRERTRSLAAWFDAK
jgi:hypothetical protein